MLQFTQHANKQYESELQGLLDSLRDMGGKVEGLMVLARKALSSGADNAAEAKALDKEINALETAIEQQVTSLLTRHTVMMDELRFVLCAIKISAALERMGDMAKNSVKRVAKVSVSAPPALRDSYLAMIDRTRDMLSAAINLINDYSEEAAAEICRSDDAVDDLYKNAIITAQRALQNDGMGSDQLAHFLFVAKNLERMADHATSLAKQAAYIHTGKKFSVN